MNDYSDLCERVERIIKSKGYELEFEVINGAYVFNIYNNERRIISNLTIVNTTGIILSGKTRSQYQNQLEDQDILHITWLSTENEYRGQNLALLLMIYSICYLKLQFPSINYVTLDDDSDRNSYIGRNIYDSLGFSFRDTIEIDMAKPKRIKLSGPEKQLLLDKNFIQLANIKLNKIDTIGGKPKSKKYRKLKRSRKSKRSRKTKTKINRNRKQK